MSIGGIVGAIIGGIITESPQGAALGYSIGSGLQSVIAPPKKPNDYKVQDQLTSLHVTGTDYGQCIPYIRGRARVAAQDWWHSDLQPITTWTVSGGGGGKGGGGGGETFTENITYQMDVWFGLADNECIGIRRIWENGTLIWSAADDASLGTLAASADTGRWDRITFYSGSSSQTPDPTYEAAVGATNAVALRGRSSVFIQGWKLGTSGQIRNLNFEVVADGTASSAPTAWVTHTGDASVGWNGVCYAYGNMFVAVGANGGAGGIMTSNSDGSAWTLRKTLSNDMQAVACGFWHVVAVGGVYGNSTATEWSSDGITWHTQSVTADPNLTVDLKDVCFSPHIGTFVAVGGYYAAGGGEVFTSPADSEVRGSWTERHGAVQDAVSWNGCCAHTTRVVAVGTNAAMYSDDAGVTWTACAGVPTGTWQKVCFDDASGNYVAVGSGAHYVMTSSDSGVTWTSRTPATTDTWLGVSAGNGVVMAVASNISMYSLDGGVTWTTLAAATGNWRRVACGGGVFTAVSSTLASADVMTNIALDLTRVTVASPTVASVVSDICLRCGVTAGQIDVTALSTITDKVDSLAWDQISSGRSVIEMLEAAFYFESVQSDKIYFKPRGAATVGSVPYLDLGASMGGEQPEPLALRQGNDLEIPAHISLSFVNLDNDYQPGTVMSDRLVTATSETVESRTMALGLTAARAQGVVETMALDRVAGSVGTTIALLGDYCAYEPTDRVVVTGPDGSTFTLRLVEKTDSYPLLTYRAVIDDATALITSGTTADDYTSTTTVAAIGDTALRLMDIPILQDADNDAGYYVAAKGSTTPWQGAAVFSSTDDVTYGLQTTVDESAVFGSCSTILGDWSGPRVFDEMNTVTVNLGAGTLSSSTYAAVIASLSVNAMLIGSEIIQFRTATLVSAGEYILSGLLRGGRGTEWAMTGHVAGERAVLLRTAGLRRVAATNADIGATRYIRGVTKSRALSSATPLPFVDNAVGLKPFSPYYPQILRDTSNNATISFIRRTRLTTRVSGTLGINVPLGEDIELYDVEIYSSSSYTTVVHTFSGLTTPTTPYTAAQQTADGLIPGDTIYAKAYQRSTTVGRGYPLVMAA